MKNYLNFKTAHLGLFILLSFLGWGCQNDDLQVLDPPIAPETAQVNPFDSAEFPASGVRLVGDRLAFKDLDTYNQAYFAYVRYQQEPSRMEEWIASFEGFTSVRSAYENLSEEEEVRIATEGLTSYGSFLVIRDIGRELEALSVVPEPFLEKVVSKHGMIQVGSDVFRHFYDYYWVAVSPTQSQIEQMLALREGENLGFGEKITINRDFFSQEQSSMKTQSANCGGNTNHTVEDEDNDRYRQRHTCL